MGKLKENFCGLTTPCAGDIGGWCNECEYLNKLLKRKEAATSGPFSEGLDPADVKIMLAQKEIKALGYQWQEQVYNDGVPECSVDFAKGTDPCTFMDGKDDFGWGRYSRAYCWEQALARIREIEGV